MPQKESAYPFIFVKGGRVEGWSAKHAAGVSDMEELLAQKAPHDRAVPAKNQTLKTCADDIYTQQSTT
jgi:hypothetical protein